MPIVDCSVTKEVKNLNEPANTCGAIYIGKLAFVSGADIDLASLTDATGEITAITMNTDKTFKIASIPKKKAKMTFSYSEDNGQYETLIEIDLGGFDNASREAILHGQCISDAVAYLASTDCKRYVIGLDKIEGEWEVFDRNKISGHDGSIGGGEESTNIVKYKFSTLSPPVHTTVDWASLSKS